MATVTFTFNSAGKGHPGTPPRTSSTSEGLLRGRDGTPIAGRPCHTGLPKVDQQTKSEMVYRSACDPSAGSDPERPVPEPILSTAREGSQEVQRTDEEEKAATQDTASVESVESEGDKRKTLLYRVGKFLIWMPKRCRYDPDNPPKFNLALNLLFAFVSPVPALCPRHTG